MVITSTSGLTGVHGTFKLRTSDEADRVFRKLFRASSRRSRGVVPPYWNPILTKTPLHAGCLSPGLSNGKPLLVHQWDVSEYPSKLINCNCPEFFGTSGHSADLASMGKQISDRFYSPTASSDSQTAALSPTFGHAMAVRANPAMNGGAVLASDLDINMRYTSPVLASNGVAHSVANANYNTPINVSQGAILTEARGIFISDIKYSVTQSDILNLVSAAGPVEKCELHKDPKSGSPRGSATVTFTNRDSPNVALRMFNGKELAGRKMKIRLDKEMTIVKPGPNNAYPQQPLVVNGSTPYQVSGHRFTRAHPSASELKVSVAESQKVVKAWRF